MWRWFHIFCVVWRSRAKFLLHYLYHVAISNQSPGNPMQPMHMCSCLLQIWNVAFLNRAQLNVNSREKPWHWDINFQTRKEHPWRILTGGFGRRPRHILSKSSEFVAHLWNKAFYLVFFVWSAKPFAIVPCCASNPSKCMNIGSLLLEHIAR